MVLHESYCVGWIRQSRIRLLDAARGFTVEVKVRDNQVDKALKVLKRKLQAEGVFREMRQREAYEKPSVAKRRRKAEAVKRLHKELRKQAEREGLVPSRRKK